ncbi:MAG: hypothetical protein IIV66_00610, partial [Alistipes sp.]|nr:hypothetical protein [Alistipes sp.]
HTALFLPVVRTDAQGQATFRFTAPDLLTRWHVKGIAHTKDLKHQATRNLDGARLHLGRQPYGWSFDPLHCVARIVAFGLALGLLPLGCTRCGVGCRLVPLVPQRAQRGEGYHRRGAFDAPRADCQDHRKGGHSLEGLYAESPILAHSGYVFLLCVG